MTKIVDPENIERFIKARTGKQIKDLFSAAAILEWNVSQAVYEKLKEFIETSQNVYKDEFSTSNIHAFCQRQDLGCDVTESLRYRWLANFMRRMSALHHAAMHPSFD